MNWRDKSLEILGLLETEISILEATEIPRTVQDISRITSLSRTGINHLLPRLIQKNLLTKTKRGRRNFYASINIEQLTQNLQGVTDQINLLNKRNKKGARVKTSQEDEFIIHVGPQEIVPAFERIALEIKNDRVKAIQHHRSFNNIFEVATQKQIVDFNRAIIKNKIIVDGILNEGAYTSYFEEIKADPKKFKDQIESLGGRMADYAVFPDNRFDCDTEIWIFKTTTLIINWKDRIAIEITNKSITTFLREMFEYVKNSSKKIDHNEAMRRLNELE